MKKTAGKNSFVKIIAAALAAVTVMTAAVVGVSASGSEVKAADKAVSAAAASADTEQKESRTGKTYRIGDEIVLSKEYAVTDDLAGSSTVKCIDGCFKLDAANIGYTMKGQFEFIGLFGDSGLCITTLDAPSTRPCDIEGIRIVSGTGTEKDPYRFETVFSAESINALHGIFAGK